MAGSPAIEVRSAAARQQVDGSRKRVTDNGPAFRVVGMRLKASILKNFRMGGWYPGKWPATHRGGQILVHHAVLRNSVHSRSGRNFAAAGTAALVYAAIHQYGGVIRAKNSPYLRFQVGGRWARKASVTIPARPYLPIKDGQLHQTDRAFIDRELTSWIVEGRA